MTNVSKLGIGVMINMLAGNKSTVETIEKALNQKITSIKFADDALHFVMESGLKFRLEDDGQSCCEKRYMNCDDALEQFVGATFRSVEIREMPDLSNNEDYGNHEVQALVVITDRGNITAETHNEHNGYYGGFWIIAREE